MRRTLTTALTTGLTAVAITAGTLVTAAPAQATVSDCKAFLKSQGYLIGPKVEKGCTLGAQGAQEECTKWMLAIGISSGTVATKACAVARA